MASICNEKNGNKRIALVDHEGRHRSLRLGKCSMKVAETTRTRIEQAARAIGVSEATIRGRIKAQRLMATKSRGAMRMTGVELNRALAAGEFNADPRGSTSQSD